MAGGGSYAQPHEIKALIFMGACVVVVGMYLMPGAKSRAPQPIDPKLSGIRHDLADPVKGGAFLDELATRTDGNFELLTGFEKQWVNGITAGHGEQMLAIRARTLREKNSKKPGNPSKVMAGDLAARPSQNKSAKSEN